MYELFDPFKSMIILPVYQRREEKEEEEEKKLRRFAYKPSEQILHIEIFENLLYREKYA